jgi:hypothetical protein
VDIESFERFGAFGICLVIMIYHCRELSKRLDKAEAYNKERDKQDSNDIKGLSGLIKEFVLKFERVIELLKEINRKLDKK